MSVHLKKTGMGKGRGFGVLLTLHSRYAVREYHR
jgi:hypothetical protein